MISAVDGATSYNGVSGPLGVTAVAEVFGPDALCGRRRARRSRNGAAEHYCPASTPIAVVTRSCTLDWDSPVFTQASSRSLVLTLRSALADARARGRESSPR